MSDDYVTPAPETATDDPKQDGPRGPFKGWGFSIAAFLLLVAILANALIELPYYVIRPGDAVPVKRFVQLPEDKAHPPNGDFMLTTVSLVRAHPYDIVHAWLTDGTEIEKRKEILGESTQKEFNEQNEQLMDASQLAAISVAMRKAGFYATLQGDGATVGNIQPGAPADGKLLIGDLITAVDGNAVGLASDVSTFVRRKKVGDSVKLAVQNANGENRDVELTLAPLPQNPQVAMVGVEVRTKNPHLDTPFPVSFGATEIGGPSAGLAFTLTLLDELTPGELTGDRKKIAVTGTIDGDGNVGPVGGVDQKAMAVKDAGVKLFIVPSSEAEQAREHAGSKVTVVGVDTLDQAIDAIGQNGGDVASVKALPPLPAA